MEGVVSIHLLRRVDADKLHSPGHLDKFGPT